MGRGGVAAGGVDVDAGKQEFADDFCLDDFGGDGAAAAGVDVGFVAGAAEWREAPSVLGSVGGRDVGFERGD